MVGNTMFSPCVVSTTSPHLGLMRSLPILLLTSDHDSASFLIDVSDRPGNTHPSLSARCGVCVKGLRLHRVRQSTLPGRTESYHESVIMPDSRLENQQASVVPVAELGSATITVEPKAFRVAWPVSVFFNVKPAHVTHGLAPAFLAHVMHKKRALSFSVICLTHVAVILISS